jgi:hypothetical protein
MSDEVFGPGQEEAFRAAASKQDTRVLFDGRTVLVTSVFHTIVDPVILSERVRRAAAGPLLRLVVGGLERRGVDGAIVAKSFVNTDESIEVVGERLKRVTPAPARVEVGIVSDRDAERVWGELHRAIEGGD